MLLFRSEEEARQWCHRHDRPFGAVVTLSRLTRLAALWYGDRLQADWQPRTAAQSQAILDRVGLTGDFWRLS
jgi:hypothetical protein